MRVYVVGGRGNCRELLCNLAAVSPLSGIGFCAKSLESSVLPEVFGGIVSDGIGK